MKLWQEIASALHTSWVANHIIGQTDFELIKDKRFIKKLQPPYPDNIRKNKDGNFEINIANTPFFSLSKDWQTENEAAAKVIVRLLKSKKTLNKDQIGHIIHKKWLKRHKWAQNDPVYSQPFSNLPIGEQKKDLKQYEIGQKIYESYKK